MDSENYKKLVSRFKNFVQFASSKMTKAKEQSAQAGRVGAWICSLSFFSLLSHYYNRYHYYHHHHC